MKKLIFLALLSTWLALPAVAQSAPQGQFTWTVAGFSPVGTCQPLPSGPPCALAPAVLGIPYTAILPTIGLKGPVACAVTAGSLPVGATLKTNATTNTSCEIDWPSPATTGTSNFTLSATGS
jgi:hypothetical protein